jgi:hypothetical protein
MVGHCLVPYTNAGGFTTTPSPEHLAYQDYAIRLIKLTLAVLVVFNKLFYCTDTNPAIAVGNMSAIPLVLAIVVSIATLTVSTYHG